MKTIILVLTLILSDSIFGQKYELIPALNCLDKTIKIDEEILLKNKLKLIIKDFKLYVNSDLNDSINVDEGNAALSHYQLVNFDSDSIPSNLTVQSFLNKTKIFVGVDSLSNVSGVYGDALDPMWGMYWSWQSGFINAKISGVLSTDSLNIPFEFHLGGYQYPFYNAQPVELSVPEHPNRLVFDIAPLVSWVLINGQEIHVMSPCSKGQEAMSKLVAGMRIE